MSEAVERPVVYRVLMSDVLFEQLGAESVDWGEPDAEGFYTPTVHTTTGDRIAAAAAEARTAALAEREAGRPSLKLYFGSEEIAEAKRYLGHAGNSAEAIMFICADAVVHVLNGGTVARALAPQPSELEETA